MTSNTHQSKAIGFVMLGIGLFLAISMYSLNPDAISRNWGGPIGGYLGITLLGGVGLIAALWIAPIVLWGLLRLVRRTSWPSRKRFVTFAIVTIVASGFAHLMLGHDTLAAVHGPGGWIGATLAGGLQAIIGTGGAFIAMGVVGGVGIMLTGNMLTRHAPIATAIPSQIPFENNPQAPPSAVNESAANPIAIDADDEQKPTEPLDFDFGPSKKKGNKPPSTIFEESPSANVDSQEHDQVSERLVAGLKEFKVEGEVTAVSHGPVVVTYEFSPAPGTKVSKVVTLRDDLSRILKSEHLRIIAPIPGKDTIGIEIAASERRVIRMRGLIESAPFRARTAALPIAMGVDPLGNDQIEDLAAMPHLLVAGSTGAGKSVFLNALIASLVCKRTAKELRLVLIDPKMIELAAFNELPHIACDVVTDLEKDCLPMLASLVQEMEQRYSYMGKLSVKNIQSFNAKIRGEKKSKYPKFKGAWKPLPYIVVVVDEFADMMITLGKDVEVPIVRLAQKARAAGIHLVVATQRPSVEVVTGTIKANFPTRISFRVLSQTDSRTILDCGGAEHLLGKGDMLYRSSGGMRRIHAAFIDDKELDKLIKNAR